MVRKTATALALILSAACSRQPENTAARNDAGANETAPARLAAAPTDPQIVEGLSGRTARVELADGRIIHVTHNRDGTARMTGKDLDMTGTWSVADGKLCFDWPKEPKECWPYAGPLKPGQTVRSTSDRGQVITTTLMDQPPGSEAPAAPANGTAPAG